MWLSRVEEKFHPILNTRRHVHELGVVHPVLSSISNERKIPKANPDFIIQV
jgi:hypothetical protein